MWGEDAAFNSDFKKYQRIEANMGGKTFLSLVLVSKRIAAYLIRKIMQMYKCCPISLMCVHKDMSWSEMTLLFTTMLLEAKVMQSKLSIWLYTIFLSDF